MELRNVDFRDFMKVVDKCSGPVFLLTEEGDKINLKSKLCQLAGIFLLIEGGRIDIANIETSNMEDNSKIFRFLLYGEV